MTGADPSDRHKRLTPIGLGAVDSNGRTPLHDVVKSGDKRMAYVLLDHSVDVYATDKANDIPIDLSTDNKQYDIIQLLGDHVSNSD